jgi:hypothetical protein
LKDLSKTFTRREIRGLGVDIKQWVLEQNYTTERVSRKINLTIGEQEFTPRSKISYRLTTKDETATRDEFHALSDFAPAAREHFAVVSFKVHEGVSEAQVTAFM